GAGARAQAGPSPAAEAADEEDTARCPTMLAPTTNVDSDALDSDDAAATPTDEDATGRKSDEAHAPSSVAGATTGRIKGFDDVKEPNIGSGYSVDYGMLARAVAEYGGDGPEGTGAQQEGSGLDSCVAAEGPGAAYAAADEHGVVTNYTDDAAAADCRLDLVDLGAIGIRSWLFDPIPHYSYTVPAHFPRRARGAIGPRSWLSDPIPNSSATVPAHFDREDRVAEADRRLGVRLQELEENAEEGAADPRVIVAGLGDSSGLPQLRAFIAAGPGFEPGSLSSPTTRTPGLLQLTDLAPGILDALDVPAPGAMSFEQTPTQQAPQQRIDDLVADAQKATTIYEHLSTFSLTL